MLDRLTADWPLKLLALVVAFGIWVSITGEDNTIKDFTVPVGIELAEDSIAAAPPPTTVTVRLEGPETAIRKLDPLHLAVRLDLTDSALGEREVQLSDPHLDGVPQGVRVAFFEPARIGLTVDRRIRRGLKVVPDVVGEPPQGYALYGAHVRPDTILVEGPESAMETLTELLTEPIPLNNRTREFVEIVDAVAPPQVRAIEPRSLSVRVIVDTTPVERTFADVPVVLRGGGAAARSNPSTLKVTLEGPPGLLQQITPGQIRVVADVRELKPGSRTDRVDVEAGLVDLSPERMRRVSVKSVKPAQVSVQLSSKSPSPS